jgi:hypothetical protein
VLPKRLEELAIYSGYVGTALAPLFASMTLVMLNIVSGYSDWKDIDYHVLCQVIQASSHSLRAVSICYGPYTDDVELQVELEEGRALAHALTRCTSLRFLRLGPPIIEPMALCGLFKLLTPLRIEFLSIYYRSSSYPSYEQEVIDGPLLPGL